MRALLKTSFSFYLEFYTSHSLFGQRVKGVKTTMDGGFLMKEHMKHLGWTLAKRWVGNNCFRAWAYKKKKKKGVKCWTLKAECLFIYWVVLMTWVSLALLSY